MSHPLRLGVNIDHVATIRNARGGDHPDPVRAAEIVAEVRLAREAETVAVRRAEIRHLHEELADARGRLERQAMAESVVTERLRVRREEERALVQAMHHDMREPLRSIVSFNQLIARRLRRRGISERGSQYLDFVADAGQRLARMLDDLLAYSTRASAQRERVALDDTLAAVRANLSAQLTRTGARLEVADDLPTVHGYATPLLQLFQNLIANALKFSRPGVPPVVRVSVRWGEDGGATLAVADNGIGIAREHLASVFALFGRGAADDSKEGSGVGLALCQRIARQHGGHLDVSSVPGEGSVFTVALPASALVASALVASALPASALVASALVAAPAGIVAASSTAASSTAASSTAVSTTVAPTMGESADGPALAPQISAA